MASTSSARPFDGVGPPDPSTPLLQYNNNHNIHNTQRDIEHGIPTSAQHTSHTHHQSQQPPQQQQQQQQLFQTKCSGGVCVKVPRPGTLGPEAEEDNSWGAWWAYVWSEVK
eukprot:TRINITY_DN6827_c0_g1_i1.p2 TRINITY_DN6827_c0_g1~~TRINITY_DN6827_c0_g1_i1.p2  ORF type:complete len:111 (+),score=37.56 TRINITY_DN6827_c0_g1_i1:103-435(+)